jgi:hypothetical protein
VSVFDPLKLDSFASLNRTRLADVAAIEPALRGRPASIWSQHQRYDAKSWPWAVAWAWNQSLPAVRTSYRPSTAASPQPTRV